MTKNNLLLFSLILFIFSFAIGCEKTPEPEMEKEMEEEFVGHEGKYPGGWTSTTPSTSFSNYPVSGIFRYSNATQTKMKAEFFSTGSYKSCCDLDNDGTMTFDIENDVITNFFFDDKIVACEGQFNGNGLVNSVGNIVIEFTGNDCDGDHIGTLVFRKQ